MTNNNKIFGNTKNGETVTAYTLENSLGTKLTVLDLGCIVQSLVITMKNGEQRDVVLGYDTVQQYEEDVSFQGAFVGRYANRIKGAEFTLEGVHYELEKNDGNNNMHGGNDGFHSRIFSAKQTANSIAFHRISKDGESGFPGNLDTTVTYTLKDDNSFEIHYHCTTDKTTVVSLTNHSYFNLNGQGSGEICGDSLYINADKITELDSESIPTGNFIQVQNTPFDFTSKDVPKKIGKDIDAKNIQLERAGGYDHNYCLRSSNINDVAAELTSSDGSLKMTVYTTMPGVQLYTGNYLHDFVGKNDIVYKKNTGLCLETGYYASSTNYPQFPSPILTAEMVFDHTTIYKFTI